MNVSFLSVTEKEAHLIGYKLKLSPTERLLLSKIAESKSASIDELLALLSSGISRGNIAVHINSVNKKADAISGRRLILFENDRYILNPYM